MHFAMVHITAPGLCLGCIITGIKAWYSRCRVKQVQFEGEWNCLELLHALKIHNILSYFWSLLPRLLPSFFLLFVTSLLPRSTFFAPGHGERVGRCGPVRTSRGRGGQWGRGGGRWGPGESLRHSAGPRPGPRVSGKRPSRPQRRRHRSVTLSWS